MTSQFCAQCGNNLDTSSQFCAKCGAKTKTEVNSPGMTQNMMQTATLPSGEIKSEKSAITALLLCLFLGALGVHRFYVGKIGTGILMLLTGGGLGIWTLIDLIVIACCQFKDKQGHTLIFSRGRNSTVKTVLTVVGSVIGVIIIYVVILVGIVMCATSGLVSTMQNQLEALRAGNIDKAYYDYTSTDFQQSTSLADFKAFIRQHPELTRNKSSTFATREINNDNTGDIKGTLTSTDGITTSIEYILVREKNMWKIIGIKIPATDAGIK